MVGRVRSSTSQTETAGQEILDQVDAAGVASAGMSLAQQRTAAEAIRQELGIAEDTGAVEVTNTALSEQHLDMSTVLPVLWF